MTGQQENIYYKKKLLMRISLLELCENMFKELYQFHKIIVLTKIYYKNVDLNENIQIIRIPLFIF